MRVSIAIGGVRGGGAAVRSILLVSATVKWAPKSVKVEDPRTQNGAGAQRDHLKEPCAISVSIAIGGKSLGRMRLSALFATAVESTNSTPPYYLECDTGAVFCA